MKFCSISDLHIKYSGDEPSKLFQKFLLSDEVSQADHIYFLGDIFDFMVGGHYGYLKKFDFFFDAIKDLIQKDKKVFYIEGNHDFHLEKVMNKFKTSLGQQHTCFVHSKTSLIQKYENIRVYFSHGHEVDQSASYQKWKTIYSSNPFKILVSYILPYNLVEYLGEKASSDSKKRNMKKFSYKKYQDNYRLGAELLIEKEGVHLLVAGHTHIPEYFQIGESLYVNNGLPVINQQFIFFDGKQVHLKKLET